MERITITFKNKTEKLQAARRARAAGFSLSNYVRQALGLEPLAHGGKRKAKKMFYATSIENFEEYSDEYNANQAGRDNGYAHAVDIHEALANEGWEQMEVAENLKRQGAHSVWELGGEAQVVFRVRR